MLKKLRVKFIAVTMSMVAAVLVVSFATICITEYQRSLSAIELALTETIEYNSELAANAALEDQLAAQEQIASPEEQSTAQSHGMRDGRPPHGSSNYSGGFEIGGYDNRGPRFPIALFSIDDQGTLTPVADATTAYLSDDVLNQVTPVVSAASDGLGYDAATGLHFVKTLSRGTTYVAFADDSNTSSWQSLAVTLALVGLGTLVIFFVIVLFLSKWALKPVDEAWKAQRQFVTDASHELKTPLTVILANTSILLKHPERSIASQSKWLESTQVEAQNMEGLVSEMLTLAQVESRPTSHPEPIDLTDLVNAQVLQFESVAFEQGFELESDIADNVVVLGDRERIRKLVSTLIENASKYVNRDGRVSVTLEIRGKNACYTVFNTGSEISEEDLPHVFDRFYRADKARTNGVGGFGLGLAIAREIARDHHGDIVAKSEKNVGTTFEATVALRP